MTFVRNSFFQDCRYVNDIDTGKIIICTIMTIFQKEKMKGGIPSGSYWNDGLSIARNLRQISGIILIESNEEEVADGNKRVVYYQGYKLN